MSADLLLHFAAGSQPEPMQWPWHGVHEETQARGAADSRCSLSTAGQHRHPGTARAAPPAQAQPRARHTRLHPDPGLHREPEEGAANGAVMESPGSVRTAGPAWAAGGDPATAEPNIQPGHPRSAPHLRLRGSRSPSGTPTATNTHRGRDTTGQQGESRHY